MINNSFTSQTKLSEEQVAKLVEHRKICGGQSGADAKVIEDSRQGKFADDPKLKKYLLCVGKKIEIINDANELNHSVFVGKLGALLDNQDLATQLDKKCFLKKANAEQSIWEVAKCYIANAPKGSAFF